MSDSKRADEAKDFIERTTKRELKSNISKNDIKFTQGRQEHLSHTDTANALLKIINVTPGIPVLSRKVMSMRIINPGITVLAVALELGIRELDVVKYEKAGKSRVKDYIDRCSLQEHTDKFNVERSIENELKNLNKTKHNPLIA